MFKGLWQSSWKLLGTKISFGDSVQGGVDTTKAVLDLSKAIGENRTLDELAPMIGHLSSILDVLNLPIVQLAGSALPFVSIASKLLQFYLESTKEEPSLEDCVELVGQAAYLETFKKFFNAVENKYLLAKLQKTKASERLQKQISQLSKNLTLTESEARSVLLCFHESKLASELNPVVLARLVDAGMEESEAKIAVERISRMTHRELKLVLTKLKDKVKSLTMVYGGDWQRDSEKYQSIDDYLEKIAQKPFEKVFDEDFGFKDIYVELQIEPIAKDGSGGQHQGIEEWALSLLNDESKSGQVLFIQGEPGRGKSVFCRMFSDRVRRELYPIWTPILIRLRDITNFDNDFDEVLKNAIKTDFVCNDSGWLTDRNTRFLFVLDGFDELLLQRGRDRSLKDFLERVSSFQSSCKEIKDRGHRVIITGRPLALFGMEREMRPNLERVKILDMSPEVQGHWLQKWAALKGEDKAEAFQEFINDNKCPEQVKTLAKEPLLLYLLAAMHGDGEFKIEDFQKVGNSAKILIYDRTLYWVLTRQRNDELNPRLSGLDVEDIRDILREAGLCVAQSGGECASLEVIESRLADNLKKALADARKDKEQDTLPVAMATFYLKATDGKNNSMEFLHKSFGEFLCAERMVDSLSEWSRQIIPDPRRPNRKVFCVEDKKLEEQIYDLFGFGALTFEIVEYLTALIEKEFVNKDDDFIRLFERLQEFYVAWSNGDFIEAIGLDGDILPLKKARLMQKQGIAMGQRKVDVYTGLNILILLFTFHRYAQENLELTDKVSFHPCNEKIKDGVKGDSSRLLRVIGYSECLRDESFAEIVGQFMDNTDLSGVNLDSVNLCEAYLYGVNLRGAVLGNASLCEADLRGADLCYADLSGAVFINADLTNADLTETSIDCSNFRDACLINANLSDVELINSDFSDVNLSGAELTGARLFRTDLSGADLSYALLSNASLNQVFLSHADLSHADLSHANLSNTSLSEVFLNGTDLSEISCNENTQWFNAIALNKAINIPDSLVDHPQFRAAVLLCKGFDLVASGDVDGAITAYIESQNLVPNLEISAFFWNQLGWFGSLYNRAKDVLFASEKAVEASPRNKAVRGLSRALMNNLDGAIEDFEAAINNDNSLHGKKLVKLQLWLDTLKSGINPFTPEELEALRTNEGWQ